MTAEWEARRNKAAVHGAVRTREQKLNQTATGPGLQGRDTRAPHRFPPRARDNYQLPGRPGSWRSPSTALSPAARTFAAAQDPAAQVLQQNVGRLLIRGRHYRARTAHRSLPAPQGPAPGLRRRHIRGSGKSARLP